jgi:chitinase
MRALICLWPFLLVSTVLGADDPRPPRVVGYYAGWNVYGRNYHPADMPVETLTHVNYAFARVLNGQVAISDRKAALENTYPGSAAKGAFAQLREVKQAHPHLKTLISVGGWTLSGGFSDAALTTKTREAFAKSCVEFILKHGFDGVDIDWEFPVSGGMEGNVERPTDRENLTRLLAEVRRQLDDRGRADHRAYLLTIAGPAGPETIKHFDLAAIHPHLDWINVMTYDFNGEWSERTGFNAALFPAKDDPGNKRLNVDSTVKAYLDAGVPPDKVVVGLPFYGRAWYDAVSTNHGLFQKHGRKTGKGSFDYRDLTSDVIDTKARRYWHDEAKVPWLYDAKTGMMITYDDPESIRHKTQYALDRKLGGVMIWELSEDDGSLVAAIDKTINAAGTKP